MWRWTLKNLGESQVQGPVHVCTVNSSAKKSSASCQYLQEGAPCEPFRLHSEILLPLILVTSPLCSAHDASLKFPYPSDQRWSEELNTGNLRFPIPGVLYQIRSYLATNSYKSRGLRLCDILIYLHTYFDVKCWEKHLTGHRRNPKFTWKCGFHKVQLE